MPKRLVRIFAFACALLLSKSLATAETERQFFVYNAANGLADNSAQTITCTKTGRLVITTIGQINFFDGEKFIYIDPTTENTYPISNYRGHAHIYFDKHHHLWFKKRNSLSCVDLMREMYVDNIVDEFLDLGISDKVHDLFCDSDNRLYLLRDKGLYCVERTQYYKVKEDRILQDLDTYDDKYLLLFYDNGELEVQELSSGKTKSSYFPYDKAKAKLYSSNTLVYKLGTSVYQIRNGMKGDSQVGILLRFDLTTWKWETIMETPYYLSNIKEHGGKLYIPSAYCYWTYDLSTKHLEHIEKIRMSDGTLLLTDINAIEFDKQGGMWLGTEKRGLLYARPYNIPFRAYAWHESEAKYYYSILDKNVTPVESYRDKTVNCVFRDSRGWDWVGTSTGLQVYRNASAHLPELITRHDGLLNNVIHCIQEDKNHNIWVGSSYGICCLEFVDDKIRRIIRYTNHDGVPSESFVNGRSMILGDGTIVMQSLDHVLTFNPGKMATLGDSVLSEIFPKLISLHVNGIDVRTGREVDGNVILEKAITRTSELNLNYNQNSIILTFSGLNYFRPEETYYRVRISGLGMKDKWEVYTPFSPDGKVDKSGLLNLSFISLVPGSYKIEVQTSMFPDRWTTTPYEWTININEPWWRTTGILLLGVLILLILLTIFLYLYLKNAGLKARRYNEELNIIKRIKAFADHCDAHSGMILEPMPEEMTDHNMMAISEFPKEFTTVMEKLLPVLESKSLRNLSMRDLSSIAGMQLSDFYQLMASNIYKNPRPVASHLMLSRAYELLKKRKDKDIAKVSAECGFVSTNYFISQFYHRYKVTPKEFVDKESN